MAPLISPKICRVSEGEDLTARNINLHELRIIVFANLIIRLATRRSGGMHEEQAAGYPGLYWWVLHSDFCIFCSSCGKCEFP